MPGRDFQGKMGAMCTCTHPGLDAGAVEGDAGVEQGDRLGHEAVADGAEELGRWGSAAGVGQPPPPHIHRWLCRGRLLLLPARFQITSGES